MDQRSKVGNQANPQTAAQRHEAELAEAILDYLSEYPHSTDTLEGIAEWWLMREQVRVEVSALVRVLGQLVERGLLEEIRGGENPRYRLRPRSGPEE